MIVTRKHAELILNLSQKWKDGAPLDKILDHLSDEDLSYLTHLDLAGLVQEDDGKFELTRAGHLIAEALQECQSSTGSCSGWDENFKFIGSEVISMIEVARIAQGDVSAAAEIEKELTRRGLCQDGRLKAVAESILTAYNLAMPRIDISPALAEKLRSCPPGPGAKALIPFDREEIYELEAMRLLTFSLPYGNSYCLTGPGQQIRAGLLKGATPVSTITDEILMGLLREDLSDELRQQLAAYGLMDADGSLLPAGRAFRAAAKLLYLGPVEVNPAVNLSSWEFKVLEAIEELWGKYRDNPEIYPDYKQLRRHLEEEPGGKEQFSRSVYTLEAFRLIDDVCLEGGIYAYDLTDLGRAVLRDRKEKGLKPVSARAVMAITTTRMENLSPSDLWIEEAEAEGLIGKGYPTKSGRLFAEMASSIMRLPLVDSLQKRVLHAIPLWRGMFQSAILEQFPQDQTDEVIAALGRLVANGLVDLLPGGLYRLTEAGERCKRAISVVPDGIEFPVTPRVLKVLLAAQESLDDKGQINWKETERQSGLEPRAFEDTVAQMRTLLYIKGDKITSAGWLLVEAAELLDEFMVEWEEIEV
jgi:hypothetical protein